MNFDSDNGTYTYVLDQIVLVGVGSFILYLLIKDYVVN